MYRITIVGSGNAGCAHAAMFSLYGHSVTLFKTSRAGNNLNFEYVRNTGNITVDTLDRGRQQVGLACVTDDPDVAFANCDICFVMVQTLYHEKVAKLLSKHVNHIKLLFVVPGYLGSLYFRDVLGERVDMIAEGESTAYDARIVEDGYVKILFKNVRNAIGVLKGDKRDVLDIMKTLVETYQYTRKNVIDSALHNPNLIVHTIGAIVSASRIEYSHGEFWMYKEAFTPSTWNIINKLDNEKMNILGAVGCERIPYVEACKFRNCEDLSVDAMSVFNSYAENGSPKGPSIVKSRYILEDVPMGLGLMHWLGLKTGTPTPMCDSLITIGGTLVGEDFSKTMRSFNQIELGEIK